MYAREFHDHMRFACANEGFFPETYVFGANQECINALFDWAVAHRAEFQQVITDFYRVELKPEEWIHFWRFIEGIGRLAEMDPAHADKSFWLTGKFIQDAGEYSPEKLFYKTPLNCEGFTLRFEGVASIVDVATRAVELIKAIAPHAHLATDLTPEILLEVWGYH